MLKFKDVSQEQTGEVVRRAAEMQQRDVEEAQVKDATVAAAEEMGISEDYLEKAAQEVHARKVNEIRAKRRRNQITGGAVAAAAALGAIVFFMRPPAPFTLGTPGHEFTVSQRVSTGTQAAIQADQGGTTITVQGFGQGQYYANAELTGPTSVAGYRSMSIDVSGTGNLSGVRIDLENGSERWKSKVISVPPSQQNVSLKLDDFQRQEQVNGQWRNVNGGKPGPVKKITVKVGDTINAPDATGSVTVRNVHFE